ncbi:MAG TPA: hypothetical protein VK540_11170 [Polyangiaceae bacterium]|nr:hypothetical protein [Polyangiaceae bacterium]
MMASRTTAVFMAAFLAVTLGCGGDDSSGAGGGTSTGGSTATGSGGSGTAGSTSGGAGGAGATGGGAGTGSGGTTGGTAGSGGSTAGSGGSSGRGGSATGGAAGGGADGGGATGGAAGSADAGPQAEGGPADADGGRFDGAAPETGAPDAPQPPIDSGPTCPPIPACNAAAPDPGPARAWRHAAPAGAANPRGRDQFVNPGAAQWVIGNFQYGLGPVEAGLQDEEVDVYLLRNCGATWEKLGTTLTTGATPSHPKVEGVDDVTGRIFFEIPTAQALGLGRHRVRLVVGGDLTAVDMFIEVVPPSTPVFVSDMDGTLTDSETAQFFAILTGTVPNANPDATQALHVLASKGYRPMYLTARPEWLVKTSQDWIVSKGFPPGILHTTLVGGGASGAAAATFKTDELAMMAQKMLKPTYVIGNTNTDADAYNNAAIQPLANRIYFQYTDTAWNGRRIEAYSVLLPEFSALPLVCP